MRPTQHVDPPDRRRPYSADRTGAQGKFAHIQRPHSLRQLTARAQPSARAWLGPARCAWLGRAPAVRHAAEKPTLPEPALNSLIDLPEKEVDSRIGRAMQSESYIPHINSMGTGIQWSPIPINGSLGRLRTTQTRLLPSSHACIAMRPARANHACRRSPSAAATRRKRWPCVARSGGRAADQSANVTRVPQV